MFDVMSRASEIINLPRKSVPTASLTIISFIKQNGEPGYGYAIQGDSNFSDWIGLLGMVSHAFIHMANPTPCELSAEEEEGEDEVLD